MWLRGLATVASGLAVFWLAPIDKRWLNLFGHLIVAGVQGVFAAQIIKPQARTLAEDRGMRCVVVDYDTLRGIQRDDLTLF